MFRGRRIQALQRKVELLEREKISARSDACEARREMAEWQRRAERFGDDRVRDARQHVETRLAAAGLSLQVDDLTAVCTSQAERLGRVVRACARYRQENAVLVAEAKRANDRADLFGGDRAVLPAVPTPETVNLRREIRQLKALVIRKEDELAAYRLQDEARDRATHQAVAA
jgi:hypothetical protein